MTEARNLKQREYGTDLISHPNQNVVDYGAQAKQRYTNTTRSNVFHFEPDRQGAAKTQAKREAVFKDNPLATKVTRASYQDSNIFGTKSADTGTVQASAARPASGNKMRQQNTFHSSVFQSSAPAQPKQRTQNTYNSNVFGDPVVENAGRKRIGGWDSGTQNLFGDAKKEFAQSSQNGMVQATKQKTEFKEPPSLNANDLKARELHGASAQKYGVSNNKRDGALMCAGGDWKNTGQQATNTSSPQKGKNVESGLNRKDKKYQQLQSSVFGGGYQEQAPIEYDREGDRAGFGTNADWKTQGGMAKPINAGGSKVDTFKQRQKQLNSNVFGDNQTDYTGYMPLNKKGVDLDNLGAQKTTIAKGRRVDDEFRQRTSGYEKVKTDYAATGQKQSHLSSNLFDRPISQAQPSQPAAQTSAPATYNIPGRETKATKQAMLASNDPVTGQSTMAGYNKSENARPDVYELSLSGLGANVNAQDIKKMAGVKHVIAASVVEDNMKGTCVGTGTVKVRLNHGETREQVELNFTKNGVAVREAASDPRKRPNLTGAPKEFAKEVTNTKNQKQGFLQTTSADLFGNSGAYQVKKE